jgi:hypothetical protein
MEPMDDAAVTDLLDERFVFRGSLGDEITGRDGFRAYRDKIRTAFPDFHNEILDLVAEGGRAASLQRLWTGSPPSPGPNRAASDNFARERHT